jgi:hypothetical protein
VLPHIAFTTTMRAAMGDCRREWASVFAQADVDAFVTTWLLGTAQQPKKVISSGNWEVRVWYKVAENRTAIGGRLGYSNQGREHASH